MSHIVMLGNGNIFWQGMVDFGRVAYRRLKGVYLGGHTYKFKREGVYSRMAW